MDDIIWADAPPVVAGIGQLGGSYRIPTGPIQPDRGAMGELGGGDSPITPEDKLKVSRALGALTHTECLVAFLVAGGLSIAEIAGTLEESVEHTRETANRTYKHIRAQF